MLETWGVKPTDTVKSGRIVKVGIIGFVNGWQDFAADFVC